jgi:hypothetical protein
MGIRKKKATATPAAPTPATSAPAPDPEPLDLDAAVEGAATGEVEPEAAAAEGPDFGPIDVFLCWFDNEHAEEKMRVYEAWSKLEAAGQVHIKNIVANGARMPFDSDYTVDNPEDFQRDRRIIAEAAAESDIYVVADSDCMPIGAGFVRHGVSMMNDPVYKDFAILTPTPSNAVIMPWTPEKDEYPEPGAFNDQLVFEHVDVGGIRFTRKGVMPEDADWRPQPPAGGDGKYRYDRHHAEQIRERGGRVGYIRSLRYKHLGEGR